MRSRRFKVIIAQLAIAAGFLLTWEFLPKVGGLAGRYVWLDPLFISSPSKIFEMLVNMTTGAHDTPLLWPFVWETVSAAGVGLVVGMVLGGGAGLLLSSSPFLSSVFQPFVTALNAVPRIALIPIIIILVGPTAAASVVIAVLVVFFATFYNAYEGGRTVANPMLQNAFIMGASRSQITRFIRFPYALGWMMSALPLATSFALLSVVTGEILTGYAGMGKLITIASVSGRSDLTFSVVVVLAAVGMGISFFTTAVRRRVLHWWEGGIG